MAANATCVLASDTNEELINFWRINGSHNEELIATLGLWEDNKETYYRVRSAAVGSDVARAARFIYLNRTAYGGIWRTNTRGEFNVPYGGGGRFYREALGNSLREMSKRTSHWSVRTIGFREALDDVRAGELVLLDPPYGHSGDAPFRRYGAAQFTMADHVALARLARNLCGLGAIIVATLPDDEAVTNFYPFLNRILARSKGGRPFEAVYASPPIRPNVCPSGWTT